MALETETSYQISDGPNPGTSSPASYLMFFLPDPASAVASSEFITAGGAGSWTVRIYSVADEGGGALTQIYAQTIPAGSNVHHVALDPAVFVVATSRHYRAIISDEGGNQCEEWDFHVYNHASVGGTADVNAANNKIRRAAHLLGWRQRVTYSDYLHGTPMTTVIEALAADLATVEATYDRKVTMDGAGHILTDISVARDTNVL